MKLKLSKYLSYILAMLIMYGCNDMDTSKYQGDGNIVSLGKFIRSGYKIEFEKFDLKNSFSQRYKIIKLPKSKKTFWCGLIVKSNDDVNTLRLRDSSLEIILKGSQNEIIFTYKAPLKEWSMAIETQGATAGRHHYYFYHLNNNEMSGFNYKDISTQDYLLLYVNYEPHSIIKNNPSGMIQIRVGGFK